MSEAKPTASEMLGELIRDLTAVCPKPKSLVRKQIIAFAQAVMEEVVGENERDVNLEPGFNITAEYRLGELRGRNTNRSQVLANWSELRSKLMR